MSEVPVYQRVQVSRKRRRCDNNPGHIIESGQRYMVANVCAGVPEYAGRHVNGVSYFCLACALNLGYIAREVTG